MAKRIKAHAPLRVMPQAAQAGRVNEEDSLYIAEMCGAIGKRHFLDVPTRYQITDAIRTDAVHENPNEAQRYQNRSNPSARGLVV